ncbi:MAG: HdeD family acid-resistance protein [Roseiarcus sp.]|jgi:uncharacterized membrane protein HdeD (DUF308 family)
MTNVGSALGLGPGAGIAPLRTKWGWIVALGVVYVIAGVIALGSVVMATIASVWVVGIMMLLAGVFEVIHSFQIKTWGRFLFWLALGVLYIIAGFVAFDNPLLTAVWLTLILGAALVASGIMRIFLAFNMQHGSPWIWVVVSGVITLLLGIIILIHWPVSSLYVLGIFLGVDLVIAGASWIGLGLGLHNAPAA